MDRRRFHDSMSGADRFLATLPVQTAAAAAVVAVTALSPSPALVLLPLLLFVAFLVVLAWRAPTTLLLLGPLLILRLSEIASGAAIEGGALMVETGVRGAATGAFARLWLLDLATFSIAAIAIESGWARMRRRFAGAGFAWGRQAVPLAILLAAVLGVMTVLLGVLAFRQGLPLFGRIDRFAYLSQLEGTPYRTIMMNRVLLAPLIGVIIAVTRTRLVGLGLLAWLIALSVVFGEKFTSLLFIVGAAAQPLGLLTLARSGRLPWRALTIVAGGFTAISLSAILLTYGLYDAPAKSIQRLEQRAALQGQLWYLADRQGAPTRIDTVALAADLASWIDPAVQRPDLAGTRFGLYYVMAEFTPSHRLEQAVAGKTGFVFALYPYLLLAGGWMILVAGAVLLAFGQAGVMLLVVRALAEGRWLAMVAFGRVINALHATVVTGYLWNAAGPKTLAALALGVVLLRAPPIEAIGLKSINRIRLNRKITPA